MKSLLAMEAYYDEYGCLLKAKNISHLYVASKELIKGIVPS
ncbi:hypothetical protein ACLHDG_04690 [Sulfurovum sp. CS9]